MCFGRIIIAMSGADNPRHTWLVLQQLRDDCLLAPMSKDVRHEVRRPEKADEPSVSEHVRILGYLLQEGAIKIHRADVTAEDAIKLVALQTFFPRKAGEPETRGVRFEKLSRRFEELHTEYSKHQTDKPTTHSARYWITKDDNGEYWYEGKNIHFKNPIPKYAKIFMTVFSLVPNGDEISYTKIAAHYKRTYKKDRTGANKKAVQRALTGSEANFFRYMQAVNPAPTHDIPFFEALRNGKEIRFNNKKI